MAGLKLLLLPTALFLTAVVLLIEPCCDNAAEPQHLPPIPTYIQRSNLVQEHYQLHSKRLQGYYESLSAALKATAPDLLAMLEFPKPLQHGYQILPKIIGDRLSPEQRPRARSAWYSWPWTEELIDGEIKEIVHSEAELKRATALSSAARRGVYEKLARSYPQIRQRQQNIHAHIQYNHLWQAAIAGDRPGYDRETVLHDAVLERQAILDAVKAPDDAAFKKALAELKRIDASHSLAEVKSDLIEREKRLARDIHDATDPVGAPAFVRVEHRGPHLWVFHMPFYTDIEDHDFVQSVKGTIEKIWRVRDGNDEFRVELAISFIPVNELYIERQPPRPGDKIDARQHLALFPLDRAILTTGALTTHVYGRAIVLGPHDIVPRVLAHEFGHVLGFRDTYFRGYKDLGSNGFQVMEVVAEPNDIMGAPGTGPVLRRHFERILERSVERSSPKRLNSL